MCNYPCKITLYVMKGRYKIREREKSVMGQIESQSTPFSYDENFSCFPKNLLDTLREMASVNLEELDQKIEVVEKGYR